MRFFISDPREVLPVLGQFNQATLGQSQAGCMFGEIIPCRTSSDRTLCELLRYTNLQLTS